MDMILLYFETIWQRHRLWCILLTKCHYPVNGFKDVQLLYSFSIYDILSKVFWVSEFFVSENWHYLTPVFLLLFYQRMYLIVT